MENVNVYSPVDDQKIKTEFQNSPIWAKAYTEEEYQNNPRRYPIWFQYGFKFEGLKPIQVTKTKKIAN